MQNQSQTLDSKWHKYIIKKKTQIISQGFAFPLWYFLLWYLLVKLRVFLCSTDAHGQTLRAGFPGWDPQPSSTLQLTESYPGANVISSMCGMIWPEVTFIPNTEGPHDQTMVFWIFKIWMGPQQMRKWPNIEINAKACKPRLEKSPLWIKPVTLMGLFLCCILRPRYMGSLRETFSWH